MKLKVNDIIKLPFNHKNMNEVEMVITGFNSYKGVVGNECDNTVLLVSEYLYPELYHMNKENINNGGWKYSDLRLQLMREIYDKFPKEIQGMIVPVIVDSDNGHPNFNTEYTIDKIFIPSKYEVSLYNLSSKKMYDDNDNYWYWTRTSYTDFATGFWYVGNGGGLHHTNASGSGGVCFCFCVDQKKLEKYLEIRNNYSIYDSIGELIYIFMNSDCAKSTQNFIHYHDYIISFDTIKDSYKNIMAAYPDIIELLDPSSDLFKERLQPKFLISIHQGSIIQIADIIEQLIDYCNEKGYFNHVEKEILKDQETL